jgi:hypothetical protein
MKIKLSYILILAVALLGGCTIEDPYENVDNTRFVAAEEFEYEVAAVSRFTLELNAINGEVEVIAIPGTKSVRIWGEKRVASESDQDASEHLEDLKVRIIEDTDHISVRTQQPENTHGRVYTVDYNIRIPAEWDVVIALVNGEVYLDNLTGETQLDLVNGDAVMRNLYGSLIARLTNGEIDVEMALANGGRCDLSTVNGRIDLAIPRSTSATVNASLTTGSISLYNLEFDDLNRTKRTLSGLLGDGQGAIVLQTVNGSISLSGE